MKSYKRTNNILGWVVFAIATITYFLTLEPTASWWDCGEYIATANKLQVGHPPGAPTFQLLGRFFSLFAMGNAEKIAMMINGMSALCSSFTILFLFWSITMLARKVVARGFTITELSMPENSNKKWQIMGAGIIGALAYTFSDTFWFSAVEGEVYAMSSLCTAIVFWAILKWELIDDERYANRWIIFIAFIIGLSIGVHLLNLLAITAISLVYYFKKAEKPTTKGVIFTTICSFIIIALVLYLMVPMIVKLAGWFELFFVNTVRLPFNSGTIIYFITLILVLAFFWWRSVKKHQVIWNTIVISFVYLLIGYSTFFIIVIRANTNTPINEGDPSNAISLLSYLNREQYGATPVFYGPYYNAPIDTSREFKKGSKSYAKDVEKKKYILTDNGEFTSATPRYQKEFCTIFPRMWNSNESKYASAYKSWGKVKGIPMEARTYNGTEIIYKPTFIENLRFFFRYQVNHMYWRYFMWNFVGRQNNIEGHGGYDNGNWISGINFIDSMRLGNQKDMPDSLKNNPARNTFFFLPLILGLIGMIYHFKKSPQGASIVLWLFIMTGLAIIVYLNQTPYQPRERDYAYAGSFYAFAIWIGFGLLGVIKLLEKIIKNKRINLIVSFIVCLLAVPTLMAQQGWDDHNRHGKYAATEFAKNYLRGCLPNSILICAGDNDTFPLWYVQEVEGFRTDVRVVNFMLSASDWYAHQMMRKVYDSEKLPLTLKEEDYYKGINEVVYYQNVGIPDTVPVDITRFINMFAEGRFQTTYNNGLKGNYLPSKNFSLKVNKQKCIENGIVPAKYANNIEDNIVWQMKSNVIYKNSLLLLDFLAGFDWDRPLYFTNPSTVQSTFDVSEYCYLDGIVYRFMPVKVNPSDYDTHLGGVLYDNSYDILVNKCTDWGNLTDPKVVIDRETHRNAFIVRQDYFRTAMSLVKHNKVDSAAIVIDKAMELFPQDKMPLEYWHRTYADVYFAAGQNVKAVDIINTIHDKYYNETMYYLSLKPRFQQYYIDEINKNVAVISELYKILAKHQQNDLASKYLKEVEFFSRLLQ